jgi:hypothetical protein
MSRNKTVKKPAHNQQKTAGQHHQSGRQNVVVPAKKEMEQTDEHGGGHKIAIALLPAFCPF